MTTPAVSDTPLVVLRLSDSFNEYWPLLARELGVPLVVRDPATEPLPTRALAVVVAAGGVEAEVDPLLSRVGLPASVPLVVAGASTSHRIAAHTVAAGAADYFALPQDRDALRSTLAAALERSRAARERAALATLEAQAHTFREIVGESPALRAALTRAARVLPHADATVLVTGETGTGKELLARALHYGGPRAAAPFVELNCAALPSALLESELFGHERGTPSLRWRGRRRSITMGSFLADESALLSELSALARQGRYREVVDRLRSLAPGVVEGRTPLALLAAESHGRLGEHDTAEEWASRALELAQRSLDARAEQRASHLRGAIAWQRGAVDEAEQHFRRALELARSLGDAEAQARAFNNIGILQHLRVSPEAALASYQPALAAYQQAGNARGMAETYHNMAISWRALGKAPRSRDADDEAVRLARQAADQTLLGLTLVGRAEAHLMMGDHALAAAELAQAAAALLLRDARELSRVGVPLHTQAELERDLGDTLDALGDAVGARTARERARALFRQLGARRAEQAVAALLPPG